MTPYASFERPSAQPPVRNRIIFKIRANDDGAVFFLFWALLQDFTRILRAKCRFLIFVRKPQRHRKKFETF